MDKHSTLDPVIIRFSPTGGNVFTAVKTFDWLYLTYLAVLYYCIFVLQKKIGL